MKKTVKFLIITIILVCILGVTNLVYGAGRLVDIPVPPDSSGRADFTSEEADEQAAEYEEQKNNTSNTTEETNNEEQNATNEVEEYVGKSSDNYLKTLEVEGYEMDPKFDMLQDQYTVYIPNREQVTSLNIITETNNDKAKVEGAGKIDITADQEVVSINVIAENGNLKVYTLRLEDEKNKPKKAGNNVGVMVGTLAIVAVIAGIVVITNKKKK